MKLQELGATSKTRQTAKVFESYFDQSMDFGALSHGQARVMLTKVRGLLAEQRRLPQHHSSEQNPAYLKLVMMEHGLAARLREAQRRRLQESEVQQAQVVLAAQDMVDSIQSMIEDATVIYRLSRAPERRVFYIDVGNMPTVKAEQYVRDIMVKYRNKLVYDSNTGEIKDDRKHLSMLEDFWLPRREGSKGTEISTLEGARNLGEMEDVKYFQSKLYKSLNVPVGRLEPQQGFSLGRSTEITRDELKFQKFIFRLRLKFAELFSKALGQQLILTGVLTSDDWDSIVNHIHFDFKRDNYFSELKDEEILRERLNTLGQIDPYVGKYYSVDWVRKNVLRFSDDDIEEMDAEMAAEAPTNTPGITQDQQNQVSTPGGEQVSGEQPAQPK